jgi:glutamate synthase domain-containing protein 1
MSRRTEQWSAILPIMCGIVGFFAKTKGLRETLGRQVVPMIVCMGDRGSDSAGLAVFGDRVNGHRRYNLFSVSRNFPWEGVADRLLEDLECEVRGKSNHGILLSEASEATVKEALRARYPELYLLSAGRSMDVYKDIGHPADISARYELASLKGSHCVGHTRMATESAVTPIHSHPFVAGEDFCLVHNGSLSNHHSLRRRLERLGIEFETDNDTEAVCRFLEWRMREGDSIEAALDRAFVEVDGFFTLLIGTADRIVLVRDAFACKPAVVAETDAYVAVGSEFRTLAHLPGIGDANLFEPGPEEIYSWKISI